MFSVIIATGIREIVTYFVQLLKTKMYEAFLRLIVDWV